MSNINNDTGESAPFLPEGRLEPLGHREESAREPERPPQRVPFLLSREHLPPVQGVLDEALPRTLPSLWMSLFRPSPLRTRDICWVRRRRPPPPP